MRPKKANIVWNDSKKAVKNTQAKIDLVTGSLWTAVKHLRASDTVLLNPRKPRTFNGEVVGSGIKTLLPMMKGATLAVPRKTVMTYLGSQNIEVSCTEKTGSVTRKFVVHRMEHYFFCERGFYAVEDLKLVKPVS